MPTPDPAAVAAALHDLEDAAGRLSASGTEGKASASTAEGSAASEAVPAFAGGPYAVSLPKEAPMALRLFDAHLVTPGGPAQVIHLPPGDAGEHQLIDLRRRFKAEPATPPAAKPDPRMTAKS